MECNGMSVCMAKHPLGNNFPALAAEMPGAYNTTNFMLMNRVNGTACHTLIHFVWFAAVYFFPTQCRCDENSLHQCRAGQKCD